MDFFYSKKWSHLPADFLSLDDYEQHASEFMPHGVYEYVAGGTDRDMTLKENRAALDRWRIMPKVLRSFNQANTQVRLGSLTLPHPILLAPVAYQKLVHEDGELATAAASQATDTPMVVSTLTSQPLSQISQVCTQPWLQLYFQADKSHTLEFIQQAEATGFAALMVTVDVPINGLRLRAQKAGFVLPPSVAAVHVTSPSTIPPIGPNQSAILNGLMATAPNWDDIAWLQDHTQLPIYLKGVINPDDALKAQQMGLAGVVVSNHGGRSLDGLPAAIDCVHAVRQVVKDDFALLLDGGIRHGSDVFKALALGANAVMIGRPIMYGLAIAGALGVAHSIKLLREEFELTMALAGCATPNDITPAHVIAPS